jgi:hypothetical protein
MRRPLPKTSRLAAFLLIALAAGCRQGAPALESLTAPALLNRSCSAREFYPLAVGNEWTYRRTFTIEVDILGGTGDPFVETFEGTVERRIIGSEEVSGQVYLVEQSTLAANGQPDVSTTWTRFRQDHAGLYVADVATNDPPGSMPMGPRSPVFPFTVGKAWREHARRLEILHRLLEPGLGGSAAIARRPGDVRPGELKRLSYPLHPKSTWFNRVDPFVVRSEVEAHEVLDLPAGRFPCYRVRVDNEFLDPDDRMVIWYGRCGRLSHFIHAETWAVDAETGEMAHITTEEIERLAGLALVEPGGCGR